MDMECKQCTTVHEIRHYQEVTGGLPVSDILFCYKRFSAFLLKGIYLENEFTLEYFHT